MISVAIARCVAAAPEHPDVNQVYKDHDRPDHEQTFGD